MNKKILNNFLSNGFVKISLFNKGEILAIEEAIKKKIKKISTNISIPSLKNFHKLDISDIQHSALLNPSTRFIDLNNKVFNSRKFKKKISEFIEKYWGHNKYSVYWVGSIKKKEIIKNKIGFRIVRPSKKKESGIEHTDAYSNNFKSFITIWIPIIGFKQKYTLRYAPKSHLIDHPKEKQIKQNKYNSKALDKKYLKKFNFKRPSLKIGQGIIHHPNILHGASNNLGKFSRVSIEIRLFDTKKYNLKEIFSKKYYY